MPDHKEQSGLVSIIIPCYNGEDYVTEAIESALEQTYDQKEIVVIDDGSTDSSLDIIKSFGDLISWRTGENHGVSSARNRGLSVASGEFIKFLSADDVLFKDALARQVEQTRKLPDDKYVVFGDGHLVDEDLNFQRRLDFRSRISEEGPIENILKVNPGTVFVLHRRTHLAEVGGFDERLRWAEDYDIHLRLHLAGIYLRHQPVDVVSVRLHSGEDRLTVRKGSEDGWGGVTRTEQRVEMIRSAGKLTKPVCRILAQGSWRTGRKALRAGQPDVAEAHFDRARELHPACVAGASRFYRWCVYLFGPVVAEHIGGWVRDIKQAVS